jgi:RHS repeat-associated protein
MERTRNAWRGIIASTFAGETRRSVQRRWWKPSAIAVLGVAALLAYCPSVLAQEIIDPRSGQVILSVTDLTVQAGPITLEVRRSLQNAGRDPGLLGSRWRLNWESRLIQAGPLVLIEDANGAVSFTREGAKGEYRSAVGDRLAFDKSGQAVRSKPDRTKEIFDARGRLVERDYRNGNRATVQYGQDGRLARIEGPHGSFLRFTSDKAGRITQAEASTTATVRYGHHGGELAEVQVPPRPPTRYGYFGDGRLSRIEEPLTGAVQLAYDFKGRVMSRTWADGSKERYDYDESGNRLRYTDAAGAVTTIEWSQDGRRQEVSDALGRKSVIQADATGRPLSVTGSTGSTSRLTYDSLGRTTAVANPLGQVTKFEYVGESSLVKAVTQPGADRQTFEYDANGNLTTIKLGSETIASFTYHRDGSIATSSGRGAPKRTFTYHPDGRVKSIANALGEATQFEYEGRGNLIREVNSLGGVVVRSYDSQDRLISLTDPVGGVTRYEYDKKGHLNRLIDPSGGVTRFEYDARGRLVAETGPTGLVTKYEYDAAGRDVKVVEPGNRITARQFDVLGNLTALTDSLGRTTQFEYDQLGRLARERRPAGLEITYRYDSLGNLIASEDNTGAKSEFQRDASGLLISSVDPLGAVTRYQYDSLGNIVGLTDPRGLVKKYAYSKEGALARVRMASGDEARYVQDSTGRLVEIGRPAGVATRFAYDAMGNPVAITEPGAAKSFRSYDLNGRLASSTDAAGRVTGYSYDLSGRLAEKRLPDGRSIKYEYDALGNRLKVDDGAFPILYQYDQLNHLVGVRYPAIKKSLRYAYDPSGLRTKLIDGNGKEIHYEYNAAKRLSAIVLPDAKRITLAYDLKDRLSSVQYPNGITGRWEYDAAGRTVKIAYSDRDGKIVSGFTYRYDPDGNPVEVTDSRGGASRYQYDSSGQLVEEVTASGTIRYRYRPGGNRAAVEEGGAVTAYRYDAADRLVRVGGEELTYDATGSLIGRKRHAGVTRYEYDGERRLVKVVTPTGADTTFGYAPTGERLWQKADDGMTYYVHDGLDLIEELDEGGSLKATYVHGPGIDRPLAMIRDGKTFYYHVDRLGSVSHLTDEQGRVVAAYVYDPFGKMREQHGSIRNPFTFTGREYDASTGLYYYRARYYDAALGRFLTIDPVPPRMTEPLELNPYLYVRNSPLRFVDPLGLMTETPGNKLWWLEQGIEDMRELINNPEKQGLPRGAFRSEYEAGLARLEAQAAALRAEHPGLQAETPPAVEAQSANLRQIEAKIRAQEAAGRPRTPTIKMQQPQAGQTGAVPRPGAPGSQTAAVPRPGTSAPEAPATPGGRVLGMRPETLGRVVVGATAALQLASCLELGKGIEQCSLEAGIGLAVGLAIAKAAAATGLTIPVLIAAGGYGWLQVAGEGSRQVRDLLDRRRAEQARQAQQQENLKNKEKIIGGLEQQIDGQLAALRGQIAGAVAGARGAAQSAANAANAASSLLTQLKGVGAKIGPAVTACKEVESLMSQIASTAANAKRFADLARQAFDFAGSTVDACQSKEELNRANEAYDSAKHLASGAASNYRRAQEAIDKLNAIRAQSESARSVLSQASGIVGKIRAEYDSAIDFMRNGQAEAAKADQLYADLKTRKNAMLTQVGNIRNVFPSEAMQEVDQRLSSLVGRLTAEEPAPAVSGLENWARGEEGRAGEIWSQAEALRGEFEAFPLCDQVVPPSIDEAAQALANLGLGGMGEGFAGKAAACLAKLTPGQAPPATAGGDTPPADPTLTSFGVSCSPSKIKVGQSSSCKAVGEYSTQPGVGVDLTHLAAWGPGPTIIGDWPGSWFARASHGGMSGTATVTVVAGDPQPPPNIPGATQAGTQFQGQQPGGTPPGPTSGATGGQVVEQPGLKPPPPGPGDGGTSGQPPPQQGGIVCYSQMTQEYYTIPYGPCPPPHMKPPTGSTAGGEPGRVPWQGLVPPEGTPPMGGTGSCSPPCHIKPGTTMCHCPDGSPSKPGGGG